MLLHVDPMQRYAKARAHTATHMLHVALTQIIPDTKQAGSLVDEDYLRFDFYADAMLTDGQIKQIINFVNKHIRQSLPVTISEMSYNDAITHGAKAFFEDKYGDTVRVVEVDKQVSIELCGGTHVTNTQQIGAFMIISQESVAAGTKRIVAYTGPKVADYAQEQVDYIQNIASKFSVPAKQLINKIDKELSEIQSLRDQVAALQEQAISIQLRDLPSTEQHGFICYIISADSALLVHALANIAKIAKDIFPQQETMIRNEQGSFVIISPAGHAKTFAKQHNLKGWWSDHFFQGKDVQILSLLASLPTN
jgi:alanyl-tRNA synthetase